MMIEITSNGILPGLTPMIANTRTPIPPAKPIPIPPNLAPRKMASRTMTNSTAIIVFTPCLNLNVKVKKLCLPESKKARCPEEHACLRGLPNIYIIVHFHRYNVSLYRLGASGFQQRKCRPVRLQLTNRAPEPLPAHFYRFPHRFYPQCHHYGGQ